MMTTSRTQRTTRTESTTRTEEERRFALKNLAAGVYLPTEWPLAPEEPVWR
jgi:hypothetical protein